MSNDGTGLSDRYVTLREHSV